MTTIPFILTETRPDKTTLSVKIDSPLLKRPVTMTLGRTANDCNGLSILHNEGPLKLVAASNKRQVEVRVIHRGEKGLSINKTTYPWDSPPLQ